MSTQSISVTIITPQGFTARVQAAGIQVTTAMGRIEVLRDHAPLLATLKPGKLKITPIGSNKAATFLYIDKSGVMEVYKNQITILADNGFFGKDLNKEELMNSEKELRKKLAANTTEALGVTLDALSEINEKLKIVDEIRDETTRT